MPLNADIIAGMESDIAAAMDDSTDVLVYRRTNVSGTASPVARNDELTEEGPMTSADLEFVAARSAWVDIPGEGDVVTLNGSPAWVDGVVQDDAAVTVRLRRGA